MIWKHSLSITSWAAGDHQPLWIASVAKQRSIRTAADNNDFFITMLLSGFDNFHTHLVDFRTFCPGFCFNT